MLKVSELNYKTKGFELKDVNLFIKENECHIIMGSSGSGKTTLLECILGLKNIISGRIFLNGTEITNLPTYKRNIAYVPQDLGLFPHLNVYENIVFGARIKGVINDDLINHIVEVMELGKILENKVSETSGGEKKRIALARALAMKPKLLLLDEPLTNLDNAIAEELQFFIKRLQEEFRLTILYVTHNFDEAFFLGDVISVMINGRLVQTSKKQELYFYPRTLAVANFLGIKNIYKGFYKEEKENEFIVYVPELKTDLKINKRPKFPAFEKGKPIYIGIRSDEVMYIRKERERSAFDNILSGRIERIYRMESSSKMLFRVGNISVEIDMPYGVLRKLQLKEGINGEVMFKKEAIFIAEFES